MNDMTYTYGLWYQKYLLLLFFCLFSRLSWCYHRQVSLSPVLCFQCVLFISFMCVYCTHFIACVSSRLTLESVTDLSLTGQEASVRNLPDINLPAVWSTGQPRVVIHHMHPGVFVSRWELYIHKVYSGWGMYHRLQGEHNAQLAHAFWLEHYPQGWSRLVSDHSLSHWCLLSRLSSLSEEKVCSYCSRHSCSAHPALWTDQALWQLRLK